MFSTLLRMGMYLFLLFAGLMPSGNLSAKEAKRDHLLLTSDGILTSGYRQARLIRTAISGQIPGGTKLTSHPDSLTRINMLTDSKSDACFCGPIAYLAQEGLAGFDTRASGPQPLRLLLSSSGSFAMTFAVDEAISQTDLSGLRGKRVAWLREDHQFNFHTTALLAYARLNWQDVQQVVFPDYTAALEGFERDFVDAVLTLSSDPSLKELINGKRRLNLATFSAANKTAWDRVNNLAPYLKPQNSPQTRDVPSIAGMTYAYPNLISSANLSDDKAYELTRAIVEQFDSYAEKSEEAEGWNILFQNFFSTIPFHAGSVKYFKELGIWSEEADQHRNRLLERQSYLKQVFEHQKSNVAADQNFSLIWRDAREAALNARQNNE